MKVMIDIYKVGSGTSKEEYVESISDSDFCILNSVFKIYQKNTGYKIDEYTDLVIVNSAIENLISVLCEEADVVGQGKRKTLLKYMHLIKRIQDEGCSIGFYGD